MAAAAAVKRTIAIVLVLAVAALAGVYGDDLRRVHRVNQLFDPAVIVANFRSMGSMFDTRTVAASVDPVAFERHSAVLPEFSPMMPPMTAPPGLIRFPGPRQKARRFARS